MTVSQLLANTTSMELTMWGIWLEAEAERIKELSERQRIQAELDR